MIGSQSVAGKLCKIANSITVTTNLFSLPLPKVVCRHQLITMQLSEHKDLLLIFKIITYVNEVPLDFAPIKNALVDAFQ